MPVVGAVLGLDVDLAAGLRAIFRIVQRAVDAILLNGVLRNLQAGLRFLSLLLNAAGVDAVNLKVVVVARAAGKANGALIAAAVILSEGREQGEAGPVAPVVGQIRDLIGANDRGRFGGTAVRRRADALTSTFSVGAPTASVMSRVRVWPTCRITSFDDFGLETLVGHGHAVAANRQAGKAVVAVRIGRLFLRDASIHGQNFHLGPNDSRSAWIGDRAFEHRAIDLRGRSYPGDRG